MNTVEVLAWLPSFIPMGFIDLFVGLSQAKPNPNNRLFQGPQPTALKNRMAQVKTINFVLFFLAFMCFILKAANRVHVRSEPSLCQSTNDHLFRSGNVLVTSRGKRFMKSFFASGFQDWIWRFFSPACLMIFTENCQQLTDSLHITAMPHGTCGTDHAVCLSQNGTFTKNYTAKLCVRKVNICYILQFVIYYAF